MRPHAFLAATAALAFAGCAAAGSDAAPPRTEIEELNVGFAFREPLALRASQDEALLSGPTTRMQVQTRPYGSAPAHPDGLGTWELPSAVADRAREERSCEPFKDPAVYLPVDTSLPMLCDLVLDPSGRLVVWMVGIGRPFEDVPFMQSSFLVLEDERFHAFSYVRPFPEADGTARWLRETFAERNPGMSTLLWPNKSFLLLIDETRTALESQIAPPSAEAQAAMAELRDIAFSVAPSRAMLDR
jgi:hypothetical protein